MDKEQKKTQENIQKKIQEAKEKKKNMEKQPSEEPKEQPAENAMQQPNPNQQPAPNAGQAPNQQGMFPGGGLAGGQQQYQEPPKKDIESIPENQPIFPGGPTRNKVEEWKQKYGEIFSIEFGDETYIYRSINRMEYKNILNTEGNATRFWREERMTELAVLWPEDYNNNDIAEGKAGVPTVLSEWVMRSSGFEATSGPTKL